MMTAQHVQENFFPNGCFTSFEKHKPLSTVEFEQHTDYLRSWIARWSRIERFAFIDKLLSMCEKEQVQFLWTVLQPAFHRDLVYNSLFKTKLLKTSFQSVSIPVSREIHGRAGYLRSKGEKVPLVKSAILRNEDEVRNWTTSSILPIVDKTVPTNKSRCFIKKRNIIRGVWRSHTGARDVCFPGIRKHHGRGVFCVKSAPPCVGGQLTNHMIRRHMQTSGVEIRGNTLNKNTMDLCNRNVVNKKLQKENGKPSHDASMSTAVKWFAKHSNVWEKNEFLRIFLEVLEPVELIYISGLMTVRQYKDFISLLPRHLSRQILSHLTVEELGLASQVCRTWNENASDDIIWKEKCAYTYVGVPLTNSKHWKTIYKESRELQTNWTRGRCTFKELSGHSKRVLSVSSYENLVASGGYDKTIKIWDSRTGTLIQSLTGHSKGVWCLNFLSKTLLISGSHDASIRVWNLRTGMCVRLLLSHRGPVWNLQRKDEILVSGSGDKTAKVWNIRKCQLLQTLIGHNASVLCVDIDNENRRVFTGSGDQMIRMWDMQTGTCLKRFREVIMNEGQGSAVTGLSYNQGFLVCAVGNRVLLLDIENNEQIKTFWGHEGRVEDVKLRIQNVRGKMERGLIYSAGKDGLIKYWDLVKGSCLRTLGDREACVNGIFVSDTQIICACDDSSIKVWNFLFNNKKVNQNEENAKRKRYKKSQLFI
ncbi:F-box/WD repeat-containing protein 7-like [Xenia sp. Carnegie-2017]|uniref:F-box/WD repeat-containing protein 7-like n=1 Tax=Xenia sp. Carnegie-2017 TaxID=2897299 RepID=UPI001F04086B|nr:F-box/WD repeat-containing protein 7-like [Xenia sp. Carnegie-2017]